MTIWTLNCKMAILRLAKFLMTTHVEEHGIELNCPELDDLGTLRCKCLPSDLPIMDKSERGKDSWITIINSNVCLEVDMLFA